MASKWRNSKDCVLLLYGAALTIAGFLLPKGKRAPLILAGSGLVVLSPILGEMLERYEPRPARFDKPDRVGIASRESFPASDAPAWTH